MMDDCPAPSHSGDQFLVVWEDGDREQPPGCPIALGVVPCVPVALCVRGAVFWGYLHSTQQVAGRVVKFSRVAGLCCQQHWGARAGVVGWVGGTLWLSLSQPKVGQVAGTQCQPGLSVLGQCHRACAEPVLSQGHFAIVSCATCGSSEPLILGERREGGRKRGADLRAWILLPERGTAGAVLSSSPTLGWPQALAVGAG